MSGEGRLNGPLPEGELISYARCSAVLQDLNAQREILTGLGVAADRIYLDKGLTALAAPGPAWIRPARPWRRRHPGGPQARPARPLPPDILDEQEQEVDAPVSVPEIEPGSGQGLGCLALYLVEMRATVGLKPRFDTLRASFTMLILENSGRLVMVFPRQSPRKAKATSSSDSRFRAAA